MAKKVRRVRRRSSRDEVDDSVPTLTREEEFELEYAYVLQDLRRVFILAGLMFALLIVLNLIFGG